MGTCVRGRRGRAWSAYARFRRALDTGSPVVALAAAHDLHQIGLTDALEMCLVLRGDPARFSRAVTRWHSLYAAEGRGISGPESAAVLALLLAIAGPAYQRLLRTAQTGRPHQGTRERADPAAHRDGELRRGFRGGLGGTEPPRPAPPDLSGSSGRR